MVTVEPLRNMLTVRPLPPPAYGGRLVVLDTQEAASRGEVLAVGPEVKDIKVGDGVVFSRLQGFEVQGVILLSEGAILATV